MGNVTTQALNLYALLGVPVDADSRRLHQVIQQHAAAKLLPATVLAKAERYLLNEGVRGQYNHYVHRLQALSMGQTVVQLDLYASLHLPHTASVAEIQAALQHTVGSLPLQTWLLARKWLLHPRLRERYDAHWLRQHIPTHSVAMAVVTSSDATVVPPSPSQAWPWWWGFAAVLASSALLAQQAMQRPVTPSAQRQALPPVSLALPAEAAWTHIDITAVGDTTLGSHLGNGSAGSLPALWRKHGDAYFMAGVADVLANDDLSIANLEGPLTTATGGVSKQFVFKGAPALAQVLQQGSIEAVNVANNHSHDYGEQGFNDTLQALQAAQVPAFGYAHYQILEVKGKRIALAGAKAWSVAQGKEAVDQALAHFKGQNPDYLIMSFHWGQERQYQQNASQREIAHYAIDQGFNTVLGHHPHVVQGIERYKQGVIVYSLANFVFGGNSNPSDKDSVAVKLRLDFVGKNLQAQDVSVLPLSVSGQSNSNDYRPVWANAVTHQRVMNTMQAASNVDVRMGWREAVDSQQLLTELPSGAANSQWCDDSTSVWAPHFAAFQQQRFGRCPNVGLAHWG